MFDSIFTVLVVGMGVIGNVIYELVKEKYYVMGVDVRSVDVDRDVDVMHICFPYSGKFVDYTVDYIKKYEPGLTIIESTVLPGTTEKVYRESKRSVVHSPIRGSHEDLIRHIKKAVKYVGAPVREDALDALRYYESLGLRVKVLDSPRETEIGKLLDTTYYALCIAWHQEMKRICDRLGANFDQAVSEFNKTYNELYEDYNLKVTRPVLFPGYIGGSCLIPNVELVKSVYPSPFLEVILDSNKRFEKQSVNTKETAE